MKKLTVFVSLLAIFLFGGVCGFAIALRIVRNSLSEEYFVQQRQTEETKRLKLTAEQIESAKPLYEQLRQELVEIKSDTVQAITAAAVRQGTALTSLLTPEQQEEYRKLNEERRTRFEKKFRP